MGGERLLEWVVIYTIRDNAVVRSCGGYVVGADSRGGIGVCLGLTGRFAAA